MSVTIEALGIKAIINEYIWKSKDKRFEVMLNSMLDPGGPSGSDPDPDYTTALEAINRFGGKILAHEPLDYEYDDSIVY